MCISAAIGIGTALIGAKSSRDASKAQSRAANAELDFQREIYNNNTERFEPQYQFGINNQNALAYELGLGEKPVNYTGFQSTPGFQFLLDEGQAAIEGSAAAQGSALSGNTLRALSDHQMGMASQEYNNHLNRLTGGAQMGLNAAGMTASSGQAAAAGMSQAYGNLGNAQAAGAIGVGNALQAGLNNGVGLWAYQNNLAQ